MHTNVMFIGKGQTYFHYGPPKLPNKMEKKFLCFHQFFCNYKSFNIHSNTVSLLKLSKKTFGKIYKSTNDSLTIQIMWNTRIIDHCFSWTVISIALRYDQVDIRIFYIFNLII